MAKNINQQLNDSSLCWNFSYSAFLLGVAYSVWPTRRVALSVSGEALRQQSSRNTVYIYRTYVLPSIYNQFHESYSTAQRHFLQPLPFSQRSHTDPLPSNLSRRFNNTQGPSKGTTDVAVEHEVLSKHAGLSPTSWGVEGNRDKIMKRHSHPSHINRHTECGRHGDDWLFGGFSVVELVKRIFKKK